MKKTIFMFCILCLAGSVSAKTVKKIDRIAKLPSVTAGDDDKFFPAGVRVKPSSSVYSGINFCVTYVENRQCECCDASGKVTNIFMFNRSSLLEYSNKNLDGSLITNDQDIKNKINFNLALMCGAVCTGDTNVNFISKAEQFDKYICFLSGDEFNPYPVCGLAPKK